MHWLYIAFGRIELYRYWACWLSFILNYSRTGSTTAAYFSHFVLTLLASEWISLHYSPTCRFWGEYNCWLAYHLAKSGGWWCFVCKLRSKSTFYTFICIYSFTLTFPSWHFTVINDITFFKLWACQRSVHPYRALLIYLEMAFSNKRRSHKHDDGADLLILTKFSLTTAKHEPASKYAPHWSVKGILVQ